MTKTLAQREVKDRLFKWMFEEKRNALALVNALTGSNYQNEEDVEIITIKDVLYISMKNDISIYIDYGMFFFEEQSTYNPNIPLRDLEYGTRSLRDYVERNELNLYSSKLQKIPKPYFFVIYNGKKELKDVEEYRLSDMFLRKDGKETLELTVTMYNINKGKNKELLEACRPLREYAWITNTIAEKRKEGCTPIEAIERMLKEMPKEFVVYDKIQANRLEVVDMLETEFDEEKFKRMFKKEGYEEGVQRGLKEGKQEQLLNNCISLLDVGTPIEFISKGLSLSKEEILQIAKENNIEVIK